MCGQVEGEEGLVVDITAEGIEELNLKGCLQIGDNALVKILGLKGGKGLKNKLRLIIL